MRWNASESVSTSCSIKSRPLKSSQSRSSRVKGQLALPKSSVTGMNDSLEEFTHGMVHRSLDLLNARDVIRVNNKRMVDEFPTDDLAAIVAQQSDREQAALARFLERNDHVPGTATCGDAHRYVSCAS